MRAAALTLAVLLGAIPAHAEPAAPQLEIVASLDQRPANIAVNMYGRIFATMHPFDNPRCKLVEVMKDGTTVPFPNEDISCGTVEPKPQPEAKPGTKAKDRPVPSTIIHNAIGLRATFANTLEVLDMGNKTSKPRELQFSLITNRFYKAFSLDNVTTPQSFVQDLAIELYNMTAFIADMGQADLTAPAKPAIIIFNIGSTRPTRRVLEGDPSLMPTAAPMQAEGKDITVMKDGKPVAVHAGLNPITIDSQKDWLYYGPMGAGKIYRVPISKMVDDTLSQDELAKFIEPFADKPPSDGMTIDAAGNIYLGNTNAHEIGVIDAKTRQYRPYIKDDRIVWADGFAFGPDGMLYVVINQLNRSAPLNLGKDDGVKPYLIARFKPIAMGAVGR